MLNCRRIAALALAASMACGVLATASPAIANNHDTARYAATYPDLGMRNELAAVLDAGFDVNTRFDSPEGWTLLHFAAFSGYPENVRFLLERGADPTLLDGQARAAIDTTHDETVRAILRQAMADQSAREAPAITQVPSDVPPQPSTASGPADWDAFGEMVGLLDPGATAEGFAPWEAFGRFQVGDEVLYAYAGGKSWMRGTVKQVGGAPGLVADKYLVTSEDGYDDWWDPRQVTSVDRQPYWTGFFVGDWRLSLPMSMVRRVESGDIYRVYTGGLRLPPLRIAADGTYIWVATGYGGGEEILQGRWEASSDGPGLILRAGEFGDDWLLHTASTAVTQDAYGTDYVMLSAEGHTAKEGFRLP